MDFTAPWVFLMAFSTVRTEETCYPEIGCFSTDAPWTTLLRPFPAPFAPSKINPTLYLYTRNRPGPFNVSLWPEITTLKDSGYDPKKLTAFITHGFGVDTKTDSSKWMHDMKDAYLRDVDVNVFLVDWGKGSKLLKYEQAGSNTRMVGALLGRLNPTYDIKIGFNPSKNLADQLNIDGSQSCFFKARKFLEVKKRNMFDDSTNNWFGKLLINSGQDVKKMHAIGHSLGAQISGNFGKVMKKAGHEIRRITGLDPAQPGFETEAAEVKLTKNDAYFVDVLHTDARPFLPFGGFGILQPAGHVDFYINGGALQPGCKIISVPPNATITWDIKDITHETIIRYGGCSHERSYKIFMWSLRNKDCLFVGRKMRPTKEDFKHGKEGKLHLEDPGTKKCTEDNCNVIGLLTESVPARGSFVVSTRGEPPFCISSRRKIRNNSPGRSHSESSRKKTENGSDSLTF